MSFSQVMQTYDLLDSAHISGARVAEWLQQNGAKQVDVQKIEGEHGFTDFIRVTIPGSAGHISGGSAPTLGVIGRLGGIGARPSRIGIVSDADGAIVALATALKALHMQAQGDQLPGDLIISTHICPDAPTTPHEPVPFMGSPVDTATMNKHEVTPEMDAILSVDTTKGNRITNFKGVTISPTVKEGYILPVSDDLVDIIQIVSGCPARVLPLSLYDITPYGNDLYHVNSILQPATATKAPVVGVAITTEIAVPGCATGASHLPDLDVATRFCLEVAKAWGAKGLHFYDQKQFEHAQALYGSLSQLQTLGR
ncbi:MAG TPA: DUF1177 domain-containing protein [Firmicutes bacterium]|nr:DUF1177 domain-containing protein [Bacillota bacterium]